MEGKRQTKFVHYEVGRQIYGMSLNKFKKVARDANAIYKVGRTVLVNIEKVEAFIESCQVDYSNKNY